jgi:hypothetical protein
MTLGRRAVSEHQRQHRHLDWDKDISHEELLERLAALKRRTSQSLPILDDDDLEAAAIDEAADRLTGE